MLFRKKKKAEAELPDINPDETINFNFNDLLDELHTRFFQSYSVTLDTDSYVPQKYIDKAYKQIYKGQKKKYKKVFKTDKAYQKWFKEKLPQLIAERRQQQLQEELKQLKDSERERKENAEAD